MAHTHKWVVASTLRLLIQEQDTVKVLWSCSCGDFKVTRWKGKF